MIIYEALNIINNKRYIGQTVQTLNKRKQQHINSIKYNNSKCIAFVRAMKKYGVENFKWRIVDDAEKNQMKKNLIGLNIMIQQIQIKVII